MSACDKSGDFLPVIFRMIGSKSKGGAYCIALFPTEHTGLYLITSYMHVGQHGPASRDMLSAGRPATVAEYADLLAELRSIYETGDDPIPLRVYKRATGKASVYRY